MTLLLLSKDIWIYYMEWLGLISIQDDYIVVNYIYNIQKIGFKIQFQNILQDYGIKCVTLSKIQYKTLEIDLSNYLIISLEQKRRNTALLQFV